MGLFVDQACIENYTLDSIREYIERAIDELLKTNLFEMGILEEEHERRLSKKKRLLMAMDGCMYGSKQDKEYVKEFIKELLIKYYGITMDNINNIIPFNKPEYLTALNKFDILMHIYKKQYGYGALPGMIQKYKLDELRKSGDVEYFYIDHEDINRIFELETAVFASNLDFEDKYNIIVQNIYSIYKGYGVIDDILDMQIDGISGGVNGLPESFIHEYRSEYEGLINDDNFQKIPKSYESVWIFYCGKSIHVRFLSFGSFEELQRICKNIYKFDNPGQLSKMDGFKVNKLKDGSRVVVLRPDFCETWCFFIRKFDLPDISLPALVTDNNSQLVIDLVKYLVKGSMNISVTGPQGAGKTTFLRAMIEHIYHPYTLRILEMAFELLVRKSQPYRNIVTVRETDTISGQDGLDILKKTDGAVTIVGEVASDPVAAYMIQTAQVASLFTLFSHHAKKFPELVMSLRNSLLKTGVFSDEKIAQEQIVRVLNFDIHIEKDITGKRYVERITECIPMDSGHLYEHKNIVEFDIDKCMYVVRNCISESNAGAMKRAMLPADRVLFERFMTRHGV